MLLFHLLLNHQGTVYFLTTLILALDPDLEFSIRRTNFESENWRSDWFTYFKVIDFEFWRVFVAFYMCDDFALISERRSLILYIFFNALMLYFKTSVFSDSLTSITDFFFTQSCGDRNARFSTGIHSRLWQICTNNNVWVQLINAIRHERQTSKIWGQNPKVLAALKRLIIRHISQHFWRIFFACNVCSTKLTNKMSLKGPQLHWPSCCIRSQIFQHYSSWKYVGKIRSNRPL